VADASTSVTLMADARANGAIHSNTSNHSYVDYSSTSAILLADARAIGAIHL